MATRKVNVNKTNIVLKGGGWKFNEELPTPELSSFATE